MLALLVKLFTIFGGLRPFVRISAQRKERVVYRLFLMGIFRLNDPIRTTCVDDDMVAFGFGPDSRRRRRSRCKGLLPKCDQ